MTKKISLRKQIENNGLILIALMMVLIFWVFDTLASGPFLTRAAIAVLVLVYGFFTQGLINSRKQALEEKERAEAEERALAQRRRDRALLETYGSEEEIETARAKALASSQDIVQRSEVRLEQMDAERKRLKDETDFYKNREVPHQLKRALSGNTEARAAELKLLRDVQAEVQRVNERFDADRARFRELMQQGAQPARRTS